MEFEWDEGKRQTNIDKHGIDFVVAIRIFDGFYVRQENDGRDDGEKRSVITGALDGAVITVVYTEREIRLRLVSARPASREERWVYNEKRRYHNEQSS